MTIRKKQLEFGMPLLVIDLTGPEGNAFSLMAQASQLARNWGLDAVSILREMKGGDYEHLVQVFDNHFGDFVVLER